MLWRVLSWPLRLPGRVLRSLRSARSLSVTREGKYFIGMTLGIGLAAINTGNNLLYLLLGWLFSVIVASGVMSDISLRSIRISRRAPRRIYANRPFLMELTAKNGKSRLASYSLEVEDLCEGQPIDKRCYFLKIPEGKTRHTAYRHTIRQRGRYTFQGFQVSTKFPFGLFRKSRRSREETELLVFPATYPVAIPPPRSQLLGDNRSTTVGRRGEFFGLREYRDGDDRRSIHWRSTASEGKLLVREYEDEGQRRITLLIDNALPRTRGEEEEQALENAINFCASLAQAYLDKGYALRLIGRGVLVPFSAGDTQLQRVLRSLALLETTEDDVAFSAEIAPRSEAVMVVPKGIAAARRPVQASHVMEAP